MKNFTKFVGILVLIFLPRLVLANACASNLAGGTGNWTTAGTWTSCGGVAPLATDTCTITAGDTVLINSSAPVCGVTTINGTLLGQEVAVGSFHRLVITADGTLGSSDLTISSTGILRLRKNNRIAFDTNNGAGTDTGALITVSAGGVLDLQGSVFETTIAAITAIDGDAGCGTTGRKYTITPAAGIGNAQVAGRVVFMSGQAETHHLEITSVAAGAFTVCTAYPDASSGTDTTGGQRLTAHAAFGGAHAFPAGRHSVPILGGNAACTAASTPYRCCSGADAGTCSPVVTTLGSGVNEGDPHVGDKIAIIQDVWFYVSAATDSPPKGYRFAVSPTNTTQPIMRAVNLANCGIINDGPGASCFGAVPITNAAVARDFTFNNIHDTTPNGDIVTFRGLHDYKIWWNAVHDGRQQLESNAAIGFGSDTGCGATCPPNNVDLSHNILYRTYGGAIHANQPNSPLVYGDNIKVLKNKIFDLCTTATGECLCIQGDLMNNGLVANNLCFDVTNGDNVSGWGIHVTTGRNTAVLDNWVVNIGSTQYEGIRAGQSNSDWVAATHNYVSHTRYGAMCCGALYSNVAKNIGLGNNSFDSRCFENIVDAKGNYCQPQDANDTTHTAAADCDGSGDRGCGTYGIVMSNSVVGNGNKHKVTIVDNLIIGPFNGVAAHKAIYGSNTTDFSADIDHNTVDGRGTSAEGVGLFDVPASGTGITINMRDNLLLALNGGFGIVCNGNSGVTDILGNSYISTGVLTSETVASPFGTCTSTGTQTTFNISSVIRDRSTLTGELFPDFGIMVGSSGLTAGSSSSPIGVRVLRFNPTRLSAPWSNIIVFDGSMPATICNDSRCTDNDVDGVVDLHDNCKTAFNPSQYDSDNDGKGEPCD